MKGNEVSKSEKGLWILNLNFRKEKWILEMELNLDFEVWNLEWTEKIKWYLRIEMDLRDSD